ncbi:hypothetical protein EDB85DRAFT_2272932 [Lactarius pseudohatsudake]|nr:hypothetical protein EDB85DRAFT_2272932 [Lactarius pseudohatsudake]
MGVRARAVAWRVESGRRRVGLMRRRVGLMRRRRCWRGWRGAWSRYGGGVDGGAADRVDAAVALLAWRVESWWSVAVVMLVDVAWRVAGRAGRCCGVVAGMGGWYLVAVVVAVEAAAVEGDGTCVGVVGGGVESRCRGGGVRVGRVEGHNAGGCVSRDGGRRVGWPPARVSDKRKKKPHLTLATAAGWPVPKSSDSSVLAPKNVKIFMELDQIRSKGVLCQL